MLTLLLISVLTLALNIQPVEAEPLTIVVPDDYEKIQWAVGNASDSDTILVRAGTYYECVNIDKTLTLIGENRSAVVDGNFSHNYYQDGGVFYIRSDNCEIRGFTIRNDYVGIQFRPDYITYNTSIVDNTFWNCSAGIWLGFWSGGTRNTTIISNMIKNCGTGIVITWERMGSVTNKDFLVANNTIIDNGCGISSFGSGEISDNFFFNNSGGIRLCQGWDMQSVVKNNLVYLSSNYGIQLGSIEYGIHNITGNHIWKNKYGIYAFTEYGIGGVIHNNTIEDNDYGFYVAPNTCEIRNLMVYHNNFINNTQQAYCNPPWSGQTSWDAGYPVGGNYWSDYDGTDVFSGPHQDIPGPDDFGDSPYFIDEYNQDNFPLMEPFVFPIEDAVPPYIESISRTPLIPNYDEDVEIEAVVVDNVGVNVSLLFYKYDDQWINVTMSRSGNNFTASIPAFPYNTQVEYKILAKDVNDIWTVSDIYSYTIVDNVPPEIHFVQCTSLLNIYANVTEPTSASGVNRVLLYLKIDNDWWNTTLTYDSALGLWTRTIFGYNQLADKILECFIEAYDNAGNKNTSEILSYSVEKWRIADLNRDSKVDRVDLLLLIKCIGRADVPLIGFASFLIASIVYIKPRKKKKQN